MRELVGIDLSRESVPDATTLLKFRRLLLANDLTKALFDEINAHLGEQGLLMRSGTIVDATIIAAPSSTKNAKGERDPDMHQDEEGQPMALRDRRHTSGWMPRSGWCTRSARHGGQRQRRDAGRRTAAGAGDVGLR